MKNLRLFVFVFAMLCIASVANAGSWDRETKKAFKKATTLGLKIDMSKAIIMGLDSAEFVEWYANKEDKTVKSVSLTLKRFKNYLATSITPKGKTIVYPAQDNSQEFNVVVEIKSITEDAGLTGVLSIYQKDNYSNAVVYDFKIKDGRMNVFEVLLQENAEKLGKNITAFLKFDTVSTFGFTLRK